MSSKSLSGQWLRQASVLAALGAGVLLSATFGAGCENSAGAYCVARCDCQGCSQQEREDCTDDVDDAQKYAEYDGCTSEFNDYVGCYANDGVCTNGGWNSSLACSTKGTLLRNCSARAAAIAKTACQEERSKRQACGIGGGSSSTCDSVSECQAFCGLAAKCEELDDWSGGSSWSNCMNACWTSSSSSSGGGP